MIIDQDRKILKEVGREYLLDIALDSKLLKDKLTFKEHVELCDMISTLTYKEVISLTITESIRDFEGKFGKFLKYSIAAIAGMKWIGLLKGPPVAMFLLYLFRKATDTCNLACIKKFPLSTEKKICKAECKVEGAKRIVRDLRSEINKCNQFENATKCEKALQKEYIKWSRRLQSLMVKLNQAKLGTELKARRAAAKAAAQRAKQLAASYQIPKTRLIKMIAENSEIRKKIHFRDHIDLYHFVLKEDEYKMTPPKVDPEKEKMARQALYLGLWIIPIPFFNDLINYLVKKYNFSCMTKCMRQQNFPKEVCYHQCSYLAAKYAVGILNKNLKTCNKAKDPIKCKNKTYNLLNDWKQREVEAKIKFETSMRGEIKKAKAKNLKSMKKRDL